MRKLKLFLDAKAANTPPRGISKASRVIFSVLTLLLLSIGQMWADDVIATLQLTSSYKFGTTSGSTKNDDQSNTWTATSASGSINGSWSGTGNSQYNGEQFGTGSAPWTGSFSASIPGTITSIAITANTGQAATLAVKVGTTDFTCGGETTTAVARKMYTANAIGTYTFTGSATGDIVISVSNTTKAFYLNKIVVNYTTGGTPQPIVSVKQNDLSITAINFETVGQGDPAPAEQTFTITGSNMTAALSIADLANFDYSVEPANGLTPSEGSISATVTVTPKSGFTSIAADKSETLAISGDDLSDDIEIALNAEVKAKHNIIFHTDLKVISNVPVMEGATYNLTETIEDNLIASCTYTHFEGWTKATTISDASVKPAIESSITMANADVNLYPVFSRSAGGSGISGSEELTHTILGLGSYGDGTNKGEYSWSFTQLMKGTNNTIQGNNSRSSILWNTEEFPAPISKVELVVGNAAGASNTAGLCFGSSVQPSDVNIALGNGTDYSLTTLGTLTIDEDIPANSTFISLKWTSGASYFTSVKVYWESASSKTYSLEPACAAPGQCAQPTFNPGAGTYAEAQDVVLETTTDGADIYYTLNGTDPTSGSTKYTTAIHVEKNTTIRAIAINGSDADSEISQAVYNIRYAQPTFSPAGGAYNAAQNVTISAAEADAIYYTTNGEDPTVDPANLYNGSEIALNTAGTHTIKAIAVKAGYANSSVASAVYEMNLPYGSIAEFIAGAPTAAAKDLVLETADNCIITGINGTTIYAQDASGKGIMIYGLSELPTNAAVNHQITGTINAKYQLFKHQHEMTNVDFSGATISADPVSRPAVNEYTSLSAAYAAKPMMLVKLTGVKYEGVDSYYNATFGSSKIYNTFNVFNASTVWPESNVDCDITGIVIDYNGTYELLPVFASDVVADADAVAPVFTPAGGADAENAVQVDLNSYVAINAADAKHSVNVNQVQITSTDPVSVTAISSRNFYRSTSVTKWYYGNAASASYDITIEGVTTQGTVVAQVNSVDAASAAEGDEVHILITPNTHFELATITVNGNDPDVVSAGTEYSFEMPAAAVTIAVTWNEDAKATLTFAKGEATGTEDAPTAITDYVGETVQLPANPFTYNGYKFIGWSSDGGTTKLAAGADYELAENKAFVAQWAAIPTFNDADHEWQLATSLEAGNYYVIGSASQDKTASKTITSGYMSEVDTEIEDGVIAYNELGTNTAIFLLGGNSTDGWTLTEVTTDNILGTTANKNVSWNAGTQVWAISIAEGGNATIGGNSRILHNAANTGKRFTTYTSDLSASMLLPQLYVWAEKVFKLRYDANGGTNAPAATLAVAGKAEVTDAQPTAPTGKIFDGWNENELGTGENYAAGDEISITSADVTIFAKWRDPYTYTVSYDANEGEGSMEADADQEEGSLYTIKPNEFTREGYGFAGWKAYDALDNELTITNGKFYIPTSNVTVKAQWNEIVTTNFVLVGNVNQLNAGDEVYIVAAASNNAMGAQDNVNYRSRVEIGKTAGKGRVIITSTAPVKFTLGKDGDNFTFFDGEGYLCATSSNSNYMGTQTALTNEGKWSISINANGEATIIAQGDNTRNYMQYNANSGQERFSCYKSDNTMPKVAIYKKASAEVIRGELSNGKWGTICPKQNVENATGATFYQISYLEEQNDLPFNMVFDPITGTTLTAGQPYFFIAEGEEITGVKVGVELSEADDAGVNGFYGYIGDDVKALSWKTDYVAGEDNTFVIYGNTVMRLNAATNLKSERCYININATEPTRTDPTPGQAPRRRVVVGVSGANVATGVESIQPSEVSIQKVLINGELFILRGEKMYNVNGQVVK